MRPDDKARGVPVVLVVEDDALIRELVAFTLQDAGFDVLEAAHAAAALALLEDHGPRVTALVSDVQIPGRLDGLTLASHARRRWPHLGLVLASGRMRLPENDLPERCRFLRKPYGARDIVACVREAISF